MGKNENNENKESGKVVLVKALIHCEGCSDKITKCLKGLEGVDHIMVDKENNKVIVRGEVAKDPMKVVERLQKKYSKNVELISPKPKPEKPKKEEKKEQQAPPNTVVLKMYIHCEGCEIDIKRIIGKMEGVQFVDVNRETSHVTVKGAMEEAKLVEYAKKRMRKHAEVIKDDKKREVKQKDKHPEKIYEPVILFSYPPQYSTQYLYPNQNFNDENVFACSIM
ncbi:hypothetical protein RIF29_40384 [Crotalaria pallida]|uniref:HMA domain-containing protein n=1 Tax=Crotalaria pallida TaxID=3830 RepID=A0AAN9HUA3_CROPI